MLISIFSYLKLTDSYISSISTADTILSKLSSLLPLLAAHGHRLLPLLAQLGPGLRQLGLGEV